MGRYFTDITEICNGNSAYYFLITRSGSAAAISCRLVEIASVRNDIFLFPSNLTRRRERSAAI